jgi:hypothetical protein
MTNGNTLTKISEQFGSDKQTVHGYLDIYEYFFKKFQTQEINMLEIGVLGGDSLLIWEKYFPNATIYGLDTFERVGMGNVLNNIGNKSNIKLHKVNSHRKNEVDDFFKNNKNLKFDIILDDGWHNPWGQIQTFHNFKDSLHKDGLYIIEDLWQLDRTVEYPKEVKQIELNNPTFSTDEMNVKDYFEYNIPSIKWIQPKIGGKFAYYYNEDNLNNWNETHEDVLKLTSEWWEK